MKTNLFLILVLFFGLHTFSTAQSYGENFDDSNYTTLESALAQLEEADSVEIVLTGEVTSVCQVKGCWMELANEPESVQVTFKDYGFFVPKNLSGDVVLHGVLSKETISVDELKHYAEDKKLPQSEIDKITEPQEKYRIVASGVKIL